MGVKATTWGKGYNLEGAPSVTVTSMKLSCIFCILETKKVLPKDPGSNGLAPI